MTRDQKLAVRVSAVAVSCAVFAVAWAAVRPDDGQADTSTAAATAESPATAASPSVAPRVIVHTRTRAS
jgi:hypothetical protein